MSRRDRKGLSPSLFPFLAVLVCTLGTLILLLALVAQNATNAAEQTARKQTPKPPQQASKGLSASDADALLEEQFFRVKQLVSFREEQTEELGERRDALTYIEEQLTNTRERLDQLNDEMARLNDETADTAEVDQQMLITVKQQVDSEKKALEKLRKETENQSPRIVIVPHKGPNGTDRRPIYLECTSEGVTIFPEGNQIKLMELERAAHSSNPLDAALRTIRLHALGQYNDAAPPYPLLVVRPDGIETYAAARNAMQDWDDQFGYELVPAGIELAYAQPDPILKQKVELVIRQAAAQQRNLSTYAGSNGGGGRGYPQGGIANMQKSNQRLPILSAASLDREGRANGFRSQHEPTTAAGNQNVHPNRSGYGNSGYQARSSYANRAFAATQGQIDAGDEARQWAAKIQSATNEMERVSKSGEFRQDSTPLLPSRPTTGSGNLDATSQKSAGRFEESTANVGQQSQFAKTSSSRDSEPGNNSSAGSAENSNGSKNIATNREALTDQGDGETDSQFSQTSQNGQGGTQISGDPTDQSRQAARSEQQANSQPTRPMADRNSQRVPLQRDRKNWAIPRRMVGMQGNAIVRAIRVECHPDHLVLLASGASGTTEVFGFNGGNVSLNQATLQLAAAVQERIERWGPALPGGRWAPQLQVIIKPGSERRYHELQESFRESGIEVTGRRSQ
ncbi:MAG: hypothetical protein ACPGPS_08085 [Rubripirellula sp.]